MKILIFNSGGFFAMLNNSCKSAGTLANVVLARKSYKAFGFFTLHFSFFT